MLERGLSEPKRLGRTSLPLGVPFTGGDIAFRDEQKGMKMRKLLLASSAATLLSAGAAFAQPAVQAAAPGTVAVHLNGYFQYSVGAYGSSAMEGGSGSSAYKLNDVSTAGDFRLLPGFDGQTLNGIWYGGHFEMRTAKYNAGAGKNNNTTSSQGFSSLYVQRAYGYIGMPEYGFARFGQTDSAFSLSQVGVIENFGDGAQFNSDGGASLMMPTGPSLFVYADSSALYSTDKIVYESPKFETAYGDFSGIVGFEPNSNGIKEGYANTGSTWASADSISGSNNTRRRNTVDASLSYANDIDGFANKASVGYLHSAPLGNMTGAAGQVVSGSNTTTLANAYDTMSVFEGGLQTTYAGLTVGGNIKFGQVNDNYTFKPKGGRNGFGYIVGASYVLGPYGIGVSYFNQQSAGAFGTSTSSGKSDYARTENQYGIATGVNYQLAKPIGLFVQYEYGHQHQPYMNNGTSSKGNVQEQVVAAGATLKW